MIPGRPGRGGVNVHFRAISCRCHRRIVSGVTMVATCLRTRRPSRRPFCRKASALVVGEPEAASRHLLLADAVLLNQVVDDVLLVAIDPSAEGHEQHLQGVEIGRHGAILPCLIPAPLADGAGPNIRTLRDS